MKRAQSGDREAFGLIVERYYRRVYAVALKVVRNSDDAAEVVQETFLRAYNALDRFKLERAVFPWLYQIATNIGINRIQRVRNREASLPEHEWLQSELSGPEDTIVKQSEEATVRLAVSQLPEQYRVVIELNHFAECSYAEMAEILSIPIGTVMSRLYHARRKLRDALTQGGSDNGT
jgi:RNA polymerase sigma-70 factor (ECF subfamily)